MTFANPDLVNAFPVAIRDDAVLLSSVLPDSRLTSSTFSAFVAGKVMQIPYRIYHDTESIDSSRLTFSQNELLDCILTRHHNGFVREKHLRRILRSSREWIPPFVIQLAGEYVVEILCAIRDSLPDFDRNLYREFLTANPAFFTLTKQRVISYWNCYYHHIRREDYAGFQIVRFLDNLIASST
jgi:hypothetical protein